MITLKQSGNLLLLALLSLPSQIHAASGRFDIDLKELERQEPKTPEKSEKKKGQSLKKRASEGGSEQKPTDNAETVRYTIQPGDHIFKILIVRFGMSNEAAERLVSEILRINNISNFKHLSIGQTILIPGKGQQERMAKTARKAKTRGSEETKADAPPENLSKPASKDAKGAPDAGTVPKVATPALAKVATPAPPAAAHDDSAAEPGHAPAQPAPLPLRPVIPTVPPIPSPPDKTTPSAVEPPPAVADSVPGTAHPVHAELPRADAELKSAHADLPPVRTDLPPTHQAELKPAHADLPPAQAELKPAPDEMPPAQAELKPAPADPPPAHAELKSAPAEARHTHAPPQPQPQAPLAAAEPVPAAAHTAASAVKAAPPAAQPAAAVVPPVAAAPVILENTWICSVTERDGSRIVDAALNALSVPWSKNRVLQSASPTAFSIRVDRYFEYKEGRYIVSIGEFDPYNYTLIRLLEGAGYRVLRINGKEDFQTLNRKLLALIGVTADFGKHLLAGGKTAKGFLLQHDDAGGRRVIITDDPADPHQKWVLAPGCGAR